MILKTVFNMAKILGPTMQRKENYASTTTTTQTISQHHLHQPRIENICKTGVQTDERMDGSIYAPIAQY